jgi:hypothetical protein
MFQHITGALTEETVERSLLKILRVTGLGGPVHLRLDRAHHVRCYLRNFDEGRLSRLVLPERSQLRREALEFVHQFAASVHLALWDDASVHTIGLHTIVCNNS